MDTIRERLKQARKALGISQQEVATRCGWPRHTRINNYERGKSAPKDLDAIERLAHALDVSPGWLAFGEDPGLKLAADERELLDNYRRAEDAYRVAAAALLDNAAGTSPPAGGPTPPRRASGPEPIVLRTSTLKMEPNNRRT